MKSGFVKQIFGVAALVIIAAFPVYALTPIQVEKLLASDGDANDFFGSSQAVSLYGDIALVGACFDDDLGINSGSAYVFIREDDGNWTQEAKLVPNDGASSDYFGISVVLYGNTALVGARRDDENGINSGSVYVFTRDSGGAWTQQAKLVAEDGDSDDYFGTSVALFGDTALVGAYYDDDNGPESGSAYVFTRDAGGTWTQQAKLVPNDGASTDYFGEFVSLYDHTAIVSAHFADVEASGTNAGSAYVFIRNDDGTWTQQAKLVAEDGASYDYFGVSPKLYGDTALIGAYSDDDKGYNSGSAYIFTRNASGAWAQQAKLVAEDGASYDYFGKSAALYGDTALISAYSDDDNGFESGSAYLFTRDAGGTWTQQAKLVAEDGASYDYFGASTAIYNDTVLVSAYSDDDNGSNSGSVYVFSLSQSDSDGDGVLNDSDNCPDTYNPNQTDTDEDGLGDECDINDDDDAFLDINDNCPTIVNDDQTDIDADGIGDVCDDDMDGDGVDNDYDNCPAVANSDGNDFDDDGVGDACDPDNDGDGIENESDFCAETPLDEIVAPDTGCSIDQLCPCEGPEGTNGSWRNHGKYVSCVAKASKILVELGVITKTEKGDIVSSAAQSDCGDNE